MGLGLIATGACIWAAGMTPAWSYELTIGQTLSLSGTQSGIATELLRGRTQCVNHVNLQLKPLGVKLRLVTRDDAGDPQLALRLVREMVAQEDPALMFGAMGPAVNAAILKWAADEGMAVIAPHGGDVQNRGKVSSTAFFLTANQSAEALRLASHVTSLGLQRVAVIHSADAAGRAALTAFEEGLMVNNVAVRRISAVRPDGSDAAAAVQDAMVSDAQALLLATSGRPTALILQSLSKVQGSTRILQVYGLSSAASPTTLAELGDSARGFVMTQVLPSPRDGAVSGLVRTFQQAMAKSPGARTHAELEGCLAPLTLAEVLKRKPSVPPTRAGILAALRGAARVDLGDFQVDLTDTTHAGARFTDIVFVSDKGRITR